MYIKYEESNKGRLSKVQMFKHPKTEKLIQQLPKENVLHLYSFHFTLKPGTI